MGLVWPYLPYASGMTGIIATKWISQGERQCGRLRPRWRDDLNAFLDDWLKIATKIWKPRGVAFGQQVKAIIVS